MKKNSSDVILPDLIIPGVQKGGTTTLFRAFEQHNECLISQYKEPNVFAYTPKLNGQDPYREYFSMEQNPEKEINKFKVEASTSYFFALGVPERLKKYLPPTTKFIILLRDPVERAISAYWHLWKKDDESRPIENVFSFKDTSRESIKEEESNKIDQALAYNRISNDRFKSEYDDYNWPFRYVTNSLYSFHLERFFDAVDQEQVLIILTEQLKQNPERVSKKVEEFLELEGQFNVEHLKRKENVTQVPVAKKLKKMIDGFLSSMLPRSLKRNNFLRSIHSVLFYRGKPETDETIKNRLTEILNEEYRQLSSNYQLPIAEYWKNG